MGPLFLMENKQYILSILPTFWMAKLAARLKRIKTLFSKNVKKKKEFYI